MAESFNPEPFDPNQAMRIVDAYNKAWLARDLKAMQLDLSDDYIQWHSHIRKDFSKAEEFAMLEEALKVMQIQFHDIRRFPVENGVVQQCLGDVQLSNGAEAKNVPFAMVYHFRGNQIVRCDEYVDGQSLPKMEFIPEN